MLIELNFVGNKFLNKKPSKKDNKIILIEEKNNIHDKNAIAVYSLRNNLSIKLGYIPHYDTQRISLIKNKINEIKKIKGIINNNTYFTIIIDIIDNLSD